VRLDAKATGTADGVNEKALVGLLPDSAFSLIALGTSHA